MPNNLVAVKTSLKIKYDAVNKIIYTNAAAKGIMKPRSFLEIKYM